MNYRMILSQNHTAEFGRKDNSNILVLGQVGSGKTRSYILPNIMEQDGISMIIADPKGELRAKCEKQLRNKGYVVKSISFDRPSESTHFFNPFEYIQDPEDILMVTRILVDSNGGHLRNVDPYWDDAASLLVQACIAYLVQEAKRPERTLFALQRLVQSFAVSDTEPKKKSPLEIIFDDLKKEKPDCFAVTQWDAFSAIKGVSKTASTISSVLLTKFTQFLTPEIVKLTSQDTLEVEKIGFQKTALFVCVSDVDRSKDRLVNLFYNLLINTLRNVADRQADKGLPTHVHCFLDDFGTNVCINNLPGYISSLRSREISFSIILQSEEQLRHLYGYDANTITANCRYYLFLGSNDLKACQDVAQRMNAPLDKVLYKPRSQVIVLSNFERPITDMVYDLTSHPEYNSLENEKVNQLRKSADKQLA